MKKIVLNLKELPFKCVGPLVLQLMHHTDVLDWITTRSLKDSSSSKSVSSLSLMEKPSLITVWILPDTSDPVLCDSGEGKVLGKNVSGVLFRYSEKD